MPVLSLFLFVTERIPPGGRGNEQFSGRAAVKRWDAGRRVDGVISSTTPAMCTSKQSGSENISLCVNVEPYSRPPSGEQILRRRASDD